MINIEFELDRLRADLRWKGYDFNDIDYVIELARNDIDATIEEILDNAMLEAAQIGEAIGADKFVDELQVMRDASSYRLGTASGKTDFSEPPFPMLPKLLKNAKTAKDGSRYKVIPIRRKTPTVDNTRALGTEQTIGAINEARRQMRANRQMRSLDPTNRPSNFGEIRNRARHLRNENRNRVKPGGGGIDFRTASSKQDANTRWVNPGKDGDMRPVLNQINANLQQMIDDIITSVIAEYERFV